MGATRDAAVREQGCVLQLLHGKALLGSAKKMSHLSHASISCAKSQPGLRADIFAVLHSVESDRADGRICSRYRRFERVRIGSHSQHSAAGSHSDISNELGACV